jgi:sugar phosphate isomerase/epimerase
MYSLGWCRGIEDAGLLKESGAEYIECAVTALRLEDEREYKNVLPLYLNSPLPVRAFNLLFPGDLKVLGPNVDTDRVNRYVANVAEALSRIGSNIVVFGSGKSRFIPDGWERSRAEEQFVRLLERIADEFIGTGVTLVIEPLNSKDTNFINSVEEASGFAQIVNREPIRVLADLWHMQLDNEPFRTLVDHKDWLAHIHVADTGRLPPGTGQYPYDEFADQLRKSGYSGMISAECIVRDNLEYAKALAFMRRKLV